MGFARLAILCMAALVNRSHAEIPPAPTEDAGRVLQPAALRATVFGTSPTEMAALPSAVPLVELNVAMPWALPVPDVFWFDRKLRAWLSAQPRPAPLAIVIAGTGGDGNTRKLAVLRAALYGAGYHVLTMPSPTFPGFIVSTSSTGVAGDLLQDGRDLYAAMQQLLAHIPRGVQVTDISVLGYSLGGANAAVVKSIDAVERKLHIHRAVMINPPVSLFASVARLDSLFASGIGNGDAAIERLYRRLYAQLASVYRASDRAELDEDFLLRAAPMVLRTDADLAAAIALSFRVDLVNMFFAGDLYAGTGVVVDPKRPPRVGDSLEETARILRNMSFDDYFARVFAPYYTAHRPDATHDSLIAENRLNVIAGQLRADGDYYAQTNSDDLILDRHELAWLQDTLGSRIVVYDHGGHVGNLGERQQIADMLAMLAGDWRAGTP